MWSRWERVFRNRRGSLLAATAVALAALGASWGKAEATAPSRAAQLATILESPAGHSRKLQVIEELRTIDTGEAHEKLQHLAASSDCWV